MLSNSWQDLKFYYAKIKQILNTDSFWATLEALVNAVQNYKNGEFAVLVGDLERHPVVQGERAFHCHVYHNRFNHMQLTARFAFFLADTFNFDVRTVARAAMIHDLHSHWYDVTDAIAFARAHGESEEVQEAIKTHMIFRPHPPVTPEGWIVTAADWLAYTAEFIWSSHYVWRRFMLSLVFELQLGRVTV